jgi:hypothetical protein
LPYFGWRRRLRAGMMIAGMRESLREICGKERQIVVGILMLVAI